jgi:hypothetical protein
MRSATQRFALGIALTSFLFLPLSACTSTNRPVFQLIEASAALKAAERVQAERKSPDLFQKAQNALWQANRLYLAKEFEESRKSAILAKRFAERAEYDTEIKNSLGSGLPGE